MRHVLGVTFLLVLVGAGRIGADEGTDVLMKAIDLGNLGKYFKLVGVERTFDSMRGGYVTLKLEAKRDVDTTDLKYKIGFFDKDNQLHLSSDVKFNAQFPLEMGESIKVVCWEGREPREWKKIVVRNAEPVHPRK
jgi:hypothetical protein